MRPTWLLKFFSLTLDAGGTSPSGQRNPVNIRMGFSNRDRITHGGRSGPGHVPERPRRSKHSRVPVWAALYTKENKRNNDAGAQIAIA
jgi:hypothetical protein